MCSKRYWDALAVAISLLIAIGLIVLDVFSLLKDFLIPFLAVAFGALWLLLAVLIITSLLRQNPHFNDCVLCKADRVLVTSIALILAGALALILPCFLRVTALILHFILFALFVYTALSLACLILCLVREKKDR